MSRFWSPVVHDLTPYVPGEQPKLANLVKLNTNENPYPPSPHVLEAIRAELGGDADRLKLYPDPSGSQLKAAVARHFDVPADWVFVGNSSDEVLAHTFQALLRHDAPLLFPDITYSFYPVYCGLYGIDFEAVPLDADFAIRVDDYLARGAGKVGAVIFPNPNAPTGRLLPLAEIARLAAGLPDAPIVIDEAYVDFGGLDAIPTAVELVRTHPNILVTQTLSKSRSLAGLRVGFAIGQPELIEALTRVKDSFNSYPLDRLALVGASAALDDEAWFHQTRRQVIASRDALSASLAGLGFEVLPSAANFVFARHPGRDAATLAAALRERSIIVRHFKSARIDQFLRITVGTDAQCALLVQALEAILA
ncbi:histidinol-phosphate transaminase [Zoogloea sp.]|uniref:histidinol-phosphate transaminase n=1 Tax=Zoogloea sp. TaxID=49181 RepID=UPI001416BA89|nr:MAG: histidinol-phosphate transaminase [Zoogloea sp.]